MNKRLESYRSSVRQHLNETREVSAAQAVQAPSGKPDTSTLRVLVSELVQPNGQTVRLVKTVAQGESR